MTSTDLTSAHHLPIITARIQFTSSTRTNPLITPRIDFGALWGNADEDDADDDSIMCQPQSDPELIENNDVPIPKPAGQPGRPRSGGYNLEASLQGWDVQTFTAFSELVKEAADRLLIKERPFNRQSEEALQAICDLATLKYPILRKYANCWPALDVVKLHHKYVRSRSLVPLKLRRTQARPARPAGL